MLKKYKEVINYLLFGVLSTILNIVSYYLLTKIFDPKDPLLLQVDNILSWIITILFVYFTNRKYVFVSENDSKIKEFIKFIVARLMTLGFDMVIMGIGVSVFYLDDKIVKIFSQIVVIISNYAFSKLFVFSKTELIK